MAKKREICGCHGACAKSILNEEKYFCIEDMGVGTKSDRVYHKDTIERDLREFKKTRDIGTAIAAILGLLILLLA